MVLNLLAPAGFLLAGGSAGYAGDVKAGAAKAMMCQACHGLDGLSKAPDSPNIAGQIEPYLVAQLQGVHQIGLGTSLDVFVDPDEWFVFGADATRVSGPEASHGSY